MPSHKFVAIVLWSLTFAATAAGFVLVSLAENGKEIPLMDLWFILLIVVIMSSGIYGAEFWKDYRRCKG